MSSFLWIFYSDSKIKVKERHQVTEIQRKILKEESGRKGAAFLSGDTIIQRQRHKEMEGGL